MSKNLRYFRHQRGGTVYQSSVDGPIYAEFSNYEDVIVLPMSEIPRDIIDDLDAALLLLNRSVGEDDQIGYRLQMLARAIEKAVPEPAIPEEPGHDARVVDRVGLVWARNGPVWQQLVTAGPSHIRPKVWADLVANLGPVKIERFP